MQFVIMKFYQFDQCVRNEVSGEQASVETVQIFMCVFV